MLAFLFTGGFLAARFVWRRDLWANIVAHVAVDAAGLILDPPAVTGPR